MNHHFWNKPFIFEPQNFLSQLTVQTTTDRRENSILNRSTDVLLPLFFKNMPTRVEKHLNLGLFAKLQTRNR